MKRVLVLHSYSTDYQWTNDSNNGILDTFHAEAPETRLRTEFMDTKNFLTPHYMRSLAVMYARKYANDQPDGIIVTDNNALAFIEQYGPQIFPKAKVVATGINNAKPPKENGYINSIVAEQADHALTIRQALKFWPKTRNLFVLADATPTGKALLDEVMAAAQDLKDEIHITPIPDMTVKQLEHFVSTRHRSDLIYILPFFKAVDGKAYPQGQTEAHLARFATAPMIASWRFQMDTGVVGGHMISGYGLGVHATHTLLDLLAGKDVPTFLSGDTSHVNIYDYTTLDRFGISTKLLPKDTQYLNRPLTFMDEHRAAILPAGGVIGILVIVMILLNLNLQKQRTLNANNQRLISMDKEVIEAQRELVTTLGEIIEIRSEETGNHVKRVAKLSRLIGMKYGLEESQLILLEATSPLHDVGKIAIPETVLHKPGRLTSEEYDIIRTHTEIGRSILAGSNRELMQVSCEIAHQHHERWDGTGYPSKLKGEEISIYARITTLADVYDALMSDRCYKTAWPEAKTLEFIRTNRGKIFDPKLVDIFMDSIHEARAIRAKFPNDPGATLHHHSAPRADNYSI